MILFGTSTEETQNCETRWRGFRLKSGRGKAFLLDNFENYIKQMNFLISMALFRMRVRPRHKILINIDLAIQDCQREINEAEKELRENAPALYKAKLRGTGELKIGGTTRGLMLITILGKLKRRLLKDMKDIESEISKWH